MGQALDQKGLGFQLVDRQAIGLIVIVLAFQDHVGVEPLRGIELFGCQRQRIEVLLASGLIVESGHVGFAYLVEVGIGQFHRCQGSRCVALSDWYDRRQSGLWQKHSLRGRGR